MLTRLNVVDIFLEAGQLLIYACERIIQISMSASMNQKSKSSFTAKDAHHTNMYNLSVTKGWFSYELGCDNVTPLQDNLFRDGLSGGVFWGLTRGT